MQIQSAFLKSQSHTTWRCSKVVEISQDEVEMSAPPPKPNNITTTQKSGRRNQCMCVSVSNHWNGGFTEKQRYGDRKCGDLKEAAISLLCQRGKEMRQNVYIYALPELFSTKPLESSRFSHILQNTKVLTNQLNQADDSLFPSAQIEYKSVPVSGDF